MGRRAHDDLTERGRPQDLLGARPEPFAAHFRNLGRGRPDATVHVPQRIVRDGKKLDGDLRHQYRPCVPTDVSIRNRAAIIGVVGFALACAGWLDERSAFQPFDVSRPASVSLGDIDGDSTTDVASLGLSQDGSILTLDLSASAAGPEQLLIPGHAATLGAIDIDHDGDLDLVVVSSDGQATVFENDGRAGFQRRSVPVGTHVTVSLTSTPFWVFAVTGPTVVVPASRPLSSRNLRTSRLANDWLSAACALPRGVTSRGPPPPARI